MDNLFYGKLQNVNTDDNVSTEERDDFDYEDEANIEIPKLNLHLLSDAEEVVVLPEQLRCISHSLNLLAPNDSNKAQTNEVYKRIHVSAFAKAHKFWNTLKRSSKASDYV